MGELKVIFYLKCNFFMCASDQQVSGASNGDRRGMMRARGE